MTDSQLISLMEVSPREGRQALFNEYCNYVYAVAANKLKLYGTPEDTEECVSDCFAAIYGYLAKNPDIKGCIKPIVTVITKRTAIDAYRRLSSKSVTAVSIDDENFSELPSDNSVEAEIEKSQLRENVLDCIHKLGEPDSTIIISHYFYGRTSAQTAAALKMSVPAIQKRMGRAREKLRKILAAAGINEEG